MAFNRLAGVGVLLALVCGQGPSFADTRSSTKNLRARVSRLSTQIKGLDAKLENLDADKVQYSAPSNVKNALDELKTDLSALNATVSGVGADVERIDRSLSEAISGVGAYKAPLQAASTLTSTTWSGTLFEAVGNEIKETPVTLTFAPSSETEGAWTSFPVYAFAPQSAKCSGYSQNEGTFSGLYKVVGDAVFAFNTSNNTNIGAFASPAYLSIKDTTMTINASSLGCRGMSVLTLEEPANQ